MQHATDKRLAHLEGSGYKVAEGDPDVRGWDVMDRDGNRIGEVDDLLVDTRALKVRYLEVRLDRGLVHGAEDGAGPGAASGTGGAADAARPVGTPIDPDREGLPELDSMADKTDDGAIIGHVAVPGQGSDPTVPAATLGEVFLRGSLTDLENRMRADQHLGEQPYAGERHILVPIGRARLDTGGDLVLVDTLLAKEAASLPSYDRGVALDPGYEATVRSAFGAAAPDPSGAPESTDADPYDHGDLYDESGFYAPRRQAPTASGRTASGMTQEEEDRLLGRTPVIEPVEPARGR
ncbi:MAG TPA: PRC-barrel domain-containing protein [Thermoanaerobaculia bacterium]|nr:PRC-barrel domain-containing protein [Thermoanaerobaculia bacterium]